MHNKKILIHSNYHPENFGGIEVVVNKIIKISSHLTNLITCFYGGNSNSRNFEKNINFISRKIVFKFSGASFISFGNLSFLRYALKSDLIIFQEPYPTLWPAIFLLNYIFRKKIIVLIHANPVSKDWVMGLYDRLRAIVFSGAFCVTTSPNLAEKICTQYFLGVKVIPLSIEDAQVEFDQTFELPSRYVIYIGRLAQYKGIPYILESARLCPEVFFVIVGDGPLAASVRETISRFKLKNILFINRFVSEIEKYELISRSEFILFPSISENEAFGLVQLEGMKLRKAIINTYLDSGVNFVAPHGECAITVEKCNSLDLAEAIKFLWGNQDYANKLGKNGCDRYHLKFSDKLFCDSWESVIKDLL